MEKVVLDEVDRGLIHALHLDGRVSFSRVAAVLGVSQQTVARRYRRLREDGILRVVGLPAPRRSGEIEWMVRLSVTPNAAKTVAEALARRSDTSWVQLISGGTEIMCTVRTVPGNAQGSLLLRELPRTPRVMSVSAHCLLHMYFGGPSGWRALTTALTPAQQDELRPPPVETGGDVALADADAPLLAELTRDGRMSYGELAAATGWSETTVKRRLQALRQHGVVFFDIEIDEFAMGYSAETWLWLSVKPSQLVEVATTLAGHAEVAVVAATTGPTNLVVHALCRDLDALHEYLTERVCSLDAIRHMETAPVLQTLKSAGAARDLGRTATRQR
ncbi:MULTISPECIES: Lrp/AsnC family transcriptional regulator [Amycolatopsis]|uniref:Lrp/AsnC family transcriptional regulator n=1 Tax=Amycolatopsis albidoflavus TaxID=102226 RepID=A0ABW5I8H1_9PSEU